MTWEIFGATMIFVAMGYLIGSISNAVILAKIIHKDDVRTKGSGNAGATNTLRSYGWKTGLIVFILDILKPIVAILITFEVKEHVDGYWSKVWVQPVGLAAVIGHIYPIFFKFKGGKGAACMLGFFISMQWILAIIGMITFFIIVIKTKYVSLGSIIAPLILIICNIIFLWTPHMNDAWSNPLMRTPEIWISTIFISIIWVISVYKHKENIKRLIKGTENKLGKKK